MSARDRILARVAGARHAAVDDIESHLARHSRGPAPSLTGRLGESFAERAAALGSDIVRVDAAAQVPAAVAQYLDRFGLAHRAVCWPAIQNMSWGAQGFDVAARAARGDDAVGITGVFAAIAETGSLMLLSGRETPASVSLLPETHVAIVARERIVATMEDGFARLRAEHGAMPRAVNVVSGPSRTADVEQTVTLGAHGPRRVLIVLVEN
jgi:L-lactate dehydrogenase complex protein LldG